MSEHFPKPSPDRYNPPLRKQEREGYFRYFETVMQPGDPIIHEIHRMRNPNMEARVAAYIRTSALPRDGADVVRLEDIRTVPENPDGTKELYGRVVPASAQYVLVDTKPTESGIPDLAILMPGQTYEFGRETQSANDFSMGPSTSRKHFKIHVSTRGDVVTLQDAGSTHGLEILEELQTTAGGVPIRHPGSKTLSKSSIERIDDTLQRIDHASSSEVQKRAAKELLTLGTLEGVSIDCDVIMRDAWAGLRSREFMSNLALRDLDVAKTLIDKDIVGLHGTRSSSLLGIIQRGLQSADGLRQAGHVVLAGEHVFQSNNGQTDTSFATFASADVALKSYSRRSVVQVRSVLEVKNELLRKAHVAESDAREIENLRKKRIFQVVAHDNRQAAAFIEQNPGSLYTQLLLHDFPVAIGIQRAEVNRQWAKRGHRLLEGEKTNNEFRISTEDPISMESFPVVAVPQQYIQWVSELLVYFGHKGIEVVPIEAFP